MKAAINRALKLVENWGDEGSIAGIIDADRMIRRDDFGDLENGCVKLDQSIETHDERMQIFFKIQIEHSVRELELKKVKHCAKYKLGISTKVTKPLHAQRIRHIEGVNMRMSSEKIVPETHWKRIRNRRSNNVNKEGMCVIARMKIESFNGF